MEPDINVDKVGIVDLLRNAQSLYGGEFALHSIIRYNDSGAETTWHLGHIPKDGKESVTNGVLLSFKDWAELKKELIIINMRHSTAHSFCHATFPDGTEASFYVKSTLSNEQSE